MKNNYLVQAWLVLMLAICFGAALAGMQVGLSERIDREKLNETYEQVHLLVPGADKDATREFVTPAERLAYEANDAQGGRVGWVIKAAGQGFADKIELLIGLDAESNQITGLYVLDQKETPALGNKIIEPAWRAQFAGLWFSGPVRVVKVPLPRTDAEAESLRKKNQVAAVTGATVSSVSVANIVNRAVGQFRGKLAGNELKEKE